MGLTFLEAQRILSTFGGGEELRFLLGMSGTSAALDGYLRAAAAVRGRSARVRYLPFNTLGLELTKPAGDDAESFVLLPWDFVPEVDWRSGLPAVAPALDDLRSSAERVAAQLARRPRARYLYLPAPLPPVLASAAATSALEHVIAAAAASIDVDVLPRSSFSLDSYFTSGCPIAGRALGDTATAVIAALTDLRPESCKVLVTDLDNVMWGGGIAEEGLAGIHCQPEGMGYRHFVYQTLLKRLGQQGVLLAAVSRNDEASVRPAFSDGRMTLGNEDFVAVIASYHAKSSQIRSLAEQLNLGLDSFVFVDDNPIELEEVQRQLPAVRCVRFPEAVEDLPVVLQRIASFFPGGAVTAEDRERSALYRRRLAGLPPSDASGADLLSYLQGLNMTLRVHDRTDGDRARALQLINKTNQFNLNGVRLTQQELDACLASGARLYSATLDDRTGTHGEIVACLVAPGGTVKSWVMSCRVFQRRVEHAFLGWLCERHQRLAFELRATERNEPILTFLSLPVFSTGSDGLVRVESDRFRHEHVQDLSVVNLVVPQAAC